MADVTTPKKKPLERRRSPLQDERDRMSAGSGDAVALREIPFLAQIGLRAVPASASAAALAGAIGADLPGPGRTSRVSGSAADGERTVLWLGPDEFLLIASDEADGGPAPEVLADELLAALGSGSGQVVDLSGNRTTLELTGPKAEDVLNSAIRIDLEERAFPVGDVRSTLLGTTPVIIWRTGTEQFRLLVRASFAVHVAHWLLDAMREHVG